MPLELNEVSYADLNAKQQENYNFMKLSAVLADYGYNTIRLNDDWQGADFIATHYEGKDYMKVQLKGRLTVDRKYSNKEVYIAFREDEKWYLAPHDELFKLLEKTPVAETKSWKVAGGYSFPRLTKKLLPLLEPYRISGKTMSTVPKP